MSTRPEFVWIFNTNRRVYTKPPVGSGRIWGDLIWREHWCKTRIVGETSRSWIVEHSGTKIAKKGADPRLFLFSEEDVDRADWVNAHRHRIADAVRGVNDFATLEAIAKLVDYKPDR